MLFRLYISNDRGGVANSHLLFIRNAIFHRSFPCFKIIGGVSGRVTRRIFEIDQSVKRIVLIQKVPPRPCWTKSSSLTHSTLSQKHSHYSTILHLPPMHLSLCMIIQHHPTPESWLNLQRNYDLWQTSHRNFVWKSVQPNNYLAKEVPAQKISLDKQIRLG